MSIFKWPRDFFKKSVRTLPYVAVFNGVLFLSFGSWMAYSASSFVQRSEKSEIYVLEVERRRSDDGFVFRPLFQAVDIDGRELRYSGKAWVSPKPHDQGEIVEGLVDWDSGEIRSVSMNDKMRSFGELFILVGGGSLIFGALIIWRKRTRKD